MKAIIVTTALLLGISSQAQTTFQRTFGYDGEEYIGTMLINSNAEIVTVGKMRGMFASDFETFVSRSSDPTGAMPIVEQYSSGVDEMAHDIEQTTDGGYVIASKVKVAFGLATAITKLDASWNVSWAKKVGQGSPEAWASVAQANDGGYFLAGSHDPDTAASTQALLLSKFDPLGNEQWVKTYSHTGGMEFYDVLATTDGGCLAVGFAYGFFTFGNLDLALVKIDMSGDTVWTRVLSTPINNYGNHVMETSDGGYLVAGQSAGDAMLMKLDPNGLPWWTKSYGTPSNGEEFFSAIELSDGYLACGSMMSQSGTSQDAFLVRTDLSGDTLWTRSYGDLFEDQGREVMQRNGGGFLLAGIRLELNGSTTAWLIGTDEDGWSGCLEDHAHGITVNTLTAQIDGGFVVNNGPTSTTYNPVRSTPGAPNDDVDCISVSVPEHSVDRSLAVFPNPADRICTISNVAQGNASGITIVDMHGKEWYLDMERTFEGSQMDVSTLPTGVYLIRSEEKSGLVRTTKLSIIH